MKSTVVFLSDIHIGNDSPTCWYQRKKHEAYLQTALDFVVDNRAVMRELVLLGDVVDTWCYPFGVEPPSFQDIAAANPCIFGESGALARALDALDGAVTYVSGNHDMDVTESDVQSVCSAGGHRLRYSRSFYTPADDVRLLALHGHEFTMFNAPDSSTCWAPLPVGHFITRMVATYWQRHLLPGTTVSDLPDQGYPNGLDLESIIRDILKAPEVSVVELLLDGIAGKLGISETEQIHLRGGRCTNLAEVKARYGGLFSNWVRANGGGVDGLLVATKAALADYNASYLGWFAQREAFRRKADLVVMGHTHTPMSGLKTSLVDYLNTGFMCPSTKDMPKRVVSYATVVLGPVPVKQNVELRRGSGGDVAPVYFKAPPASVVEAPFMDFSCYVQIDNTKNTKDLGLAHTMVGNGHFVTLPDRIAAGTVSTLWLQDYPGLTPPHGSDALVTYAANDGATAVLNFDCPTGAYPNSCSGGSSFEAKAGDGAWLDPGKVPAKGHPLFVRFKILPGQEGGAFAGRCGENSFATSVTGLQPGQMVKLNGATDLSSCVRANDGAAVYNIRLDKVTGTYEYCVTVDAAGPRGALSGSMYLYFTDQSDDRYLLTVFDSTRKTHTVRYNSSAPAIMKIEWSNTAKPR